jgi:regulator of protease activity HflC (stomatin/prohibitin superfamily)
MFWLIISIIVVLGLFVVLGIDFDKETWGMKPRQIVCLLGLIFLLPGFITKVPANSVGIVYSPFGGTKEETLAEGFHGKNIFDKVYKISTEVQTMTVSNLTTQTMDAQYLTSILDIKYRVNTGNAFLVFKQFRTLDKLSENLIVPTTQRVLEHVTTRYNVIDILGDKRNAIYLELETALSEEFAKYGVEFYSISITDMDAGEALENAITAEAVAKKAVETAEQNLLKAETEAKQKSVQAQAEQDAAKIQAETKLIQAEADTKVNEMLNESLSEEVLRKLWIEKWDGEMPTYYAGSDSGMNVILDNAVVE